jgi:hypothetical protein
MRQMKGGKEREETDQEIVVDTLCLSASEGTHVGRGASTAISSEETERELVT